MKTPNIQLLMTGNELMTGDIVDSNSSMIAEQLLSLGLSVQRKVTIADDLNLLQKEIDHMCNQADILIINGGLGPTTDDMTSQALALCCNTILEENKTAKEHVESWVKKRGKILDDPQLKQAKLPKNSTVIPNLVGSAVGIKIQHKNCDIYCTPGVPSELKSMLVHTIIPELKLKHCLSMHYKVRRFQVFGIGESALQSQLFENIKDWPKSISLGFRAASPFLELKLTAKENKDHPHLDTLVVQIKNLLGAHILEEITSFPKTMAEHTIDLLIQKNKTITFAESCTGGLISSLLTNINGASKVFEAGFVTYSNEIKTKIVNVNESTLIEHGAVSEAVVIEMAKGALEKSTADYALAVSGIAGPSGGTKEKPVGLVWMAWGNLQRIHTTHFIIKGKREYVQISAANRALDLIRRLLLEETEPPFYLQNIMNTAETPFNNFYTRENM